MSKKRRTSKKHPNKKFFKKTLFKILAIFVCVAINLTGLSAIGNTFAYYTDEVEINGSTFSAGTLDLTVISGQNNFIPSSKAGNMGPGDSVARDIYVGKAADSLPLKHRVSYQFVSGDPSFCDLLQLEIYYDHYHGPFSAGYAASRDMRLKYNGPLTSLSNLTDPDFIIPHPDDQFDSNPADGTDQWFYYQITYPAGTPKVTGMQCVFKFVFDGWQINMADPSSGGFVDTADVSSTLIDSIPEIEVTSEPTTNEQLKEEQVLTEEEPVIVKDPVVEAEQAEENIETEEGDTAGQDEITQDEGSNGGDGKDENTSSGGGEEITGDGGGELTTA
jgi:predicted ribosomally synthesized peptide with SipW-like signal peptide